MPWSIIKTTKGYQLKKLTDGSINPKVFKTRQAAINMAKRWFAYDSYGRHKTKIVGNKIL